MLQLTYHSTTTISIEADIITPDQLAGKTPLQIAKLPIQHGNAQVPLGEFFHAAGDATDQQISIEGDCSRVKLIGALMKSGRITIHGNAGMHLGAEMSGGEFEVDGKAGDWVGAEMRVGLIHVRGDAGHLLGAGYRGSRLGMSGGAILVAGKAGNEIGANMRRGFIAVGGDNGDFAGRLIAGTVFVFGQGRHSHRRQHEARHHRLVRPLCPAPANVSLRLHLSPRIHVDLFAATRTLEIRPGPEAFLRKLSSLQRRSRRAGQGGDPYPR